MVGLVLRRTRCGQLGLPVSQSGRLWWRGVLRQGYQASCAPGQKFAKGTALKKTPAVYKAGSSRSQASALTACAIRS